MGTSSVDVTLSVVSAVVAVVFVGAAARRRHDRAACGAHAAMAVGMIGMFVPAIDVVPSTAGVVVFALIAAWFVVRWVHGESVSGGWAESTHLVVAPAAMAVMYLTMLSGSGMGAGMDMGSGTATGSGAGSSPLLTGLQLVLAAYFLFYAGALGVRLVRPGAGRSGRPPEGDGGVATAAPPTAGLVVTRAVTVAHVVMCLLMTVMFVGAS